MTTAREKARKAARIECDRLDSERMRASAEHYANVASDVWEPLLRDLLKAVDVLGQPVPFRYDWAIERAREALQ